MGHMRDVAMLKTTRIVAGLTTELNFFSMIHTLLLCETLEDPQSFVANQGTIGVEFVLKKPLVGHDVDTCRFGNQRPSIDVS